MAPPENDRLLTAPVTGGATGGQLSFDVGFVDPVVLMFREKRIESMFYVFLFFFGKLSMSV